MENTADLAAVTQIHAAYVQGMAAVGSTYGKSVMDDYVHWAKTAKLCVRNGISPVRFVNAQFMVLAPTLRGTLTPRMLHMPVARVLTAYASIAPEPCDYPKLYSDMCARLASVARGAYTVTDMLSDPNQPFLVWFRVVKAPRLEGKILDWYYEEAVAEYDDDPRLRGFLHKEKLDERLAISQRPGV